MLGVGYTQYICNFQLPYPTAAWHTTYTTSISQQCTQTVSSCAKLFSHYQIQQYIHSSIVHTYHNDTEEPPTTAEVWHWSKLCSGFTQAGTVNFHPRQQVCLMAVSPLSDVCESRIHFFFLQQQKDFRESCRSSATYDLWLKAES